MEPGKAAGPDNIGPEMVKHLPENAIELLLILLNRCWIDGDCPQAWREAIVVPILKKGKDPTQIPSYRPISLTSVIGKLMERLIKTRLIWWLESNQKLSQAQAGFRKGRDTTDQCLTLSQLISDGFHARPPKRTILAQFDFARAFDTVWRDKLLQKMIGMGIPPRFTRYIKGWLVNRKASVKYQQVYSKQRVFKAGLPQGAVLSPLLFLLFIDDLLRDFQPSTAICAFADDLALACTDHIKLRAQAQLQAETDKVTQWSDANRMKLNADKCTVSLFTTSSKEADWRPILRIGDVQAPFEANPILLGVKI
jgi:Reverse transcriptase (RNA-dependent DNA polymerase)